MYQEYSILDILNNPFGILISSLLFILLIFVLLIGSYLWNYSINEPYDDSGNQYSFIHRPPYYPLWSPLFDRYRWWGTQLRSTRNMSYDLRGDPIVIPRFYY